MPIIGTVQATGEFAPSSTGDTYAILDAKYIRDGFRNVDTITDLDSITTDRRIAGMVAGVSGGTAYYKLNPEPWLYDFTDWSTFSTSSSGNTGGIKYNILSGETVDIAADYEYFVYGNLTLEGTINNSGKIIIMNGVFINSGGTYNQLSGGSVTLVSSQTINKYSITTGLTANTPLVITHNLGTPDVMITVKDLDTGYKIGVDEYSYNLNDVTVESTNTLTNIRITIVG
jgi:hypothetical protein